MKYEIVQTGSTGNCTILEDVLALDMGVAFKKVAPYMRALQLVFVSHEHGDHFKDSTIRNLARSRPLLRFCCGEFLVQKFLDAGVSTRNIDILEAGTRYDYGAFQVEPIALAHDVPNYGLRVFMKGQKAVYIVDTGHLEGVEAKGYNLYLVEANHTTAEIEERAAEKRAAGEYCYEIRAAENHLSYEQTIEWLTENMDSRGIWVPMHQHVEQEEQGGCQTD